jgi:hypothetical protein
MQQPRESQYPSNEWGGHPPMAEWVRPRSNTGFLLTGLVLIGLGALAWQYLGPDLRRYMKIRSM